MICIFLQNLYFHYIMKLKTVNVSFFSFFKLQHNLQKNIMMLHPEFKYKLLSSLIHLIFSSVPFEKIKFDRIKALLYNQKVPSPFNKTFKLIPQKYITLKALEHDRYKNTIQNKYKKSIFLHHLNHLSFHSAIHKCFAVIPFITITCTSFWGKGINCLARKTFPYALKCWLENVFF